MVDCLPPQTPSSARLRCASAARPRAAELRATGVDPAALAPAERAAGGALFVADAARGGAYVPLDAAVWERIARGAMRL